jgi:hypothetical protein
MQLLLGLKWLNNSILSFTAHQKRDQRVCKNDRNNPKLFCTTASTAQILRSFRVALYISHNSRHMPLPKFYKEEWMLRETVNHQCKTTGLLIIFSSFLHL